MHPTFVGDNVIIQVKCWVTLVNCMQLIFQLYHIGINIKNQWKRKSRDQKGTLLHWMLQPVNQDWLPHMNNHSLDQSMTSDESHVMLKEKDQKPWIFLRTSHLESQPGNRYRETYDCSIKGVYMLTGPPPRCLNC